MSNLNRISLLKTYCKEEPENPFNYYALALEYRDFEPEQASQLFELLITDFPNYLPLYFPAAHFYWEVQQLEKAKLLFERGMALATQVQDEKAKKELGNAYQNFLFETDLD